MPSRPVYWDGPDDTPTCLNGHSFKLNYEVRSKPQVVRERTQDNIERDEVAKLQREDRIKRWRELKKQLTCWKVIFATISRYICNGDQNRLYNFGRGYMLDAEEEKLKQAIKDWNSGKLTKEFLVNNFGNYHQQRSKRTKTKNEAKTF